MTWRLTNVTIDLGTDAPNFAAYVRDGELWNGWAIPYFTKLEGDQVMEWTNTTAAADRGGPTVQWDGIGYQLHTDETGAGELPQLCPPVTIDVDGDTLLTWSIGGMAWCWEEVRPGETWKCPGCDATIDAGGVRDHVADCEFVDGAGHVIEEPDHSMRKEDARNRVVCASCDVAEADAFVGDGSRCLPCYDEHQLDEYEEDAAALDEIADVLSGTE